MIYMTIFEICMKNSMKGSKINYVCMHIHKYMYIRIPNVVGTLKTPKCSSNEKSIDGR